MVSGPHHSTFCRRHGVWHPPGDACGAGAPRTLTFADLAQARPGRDGAVSFGLDLRRLDGAEVLIRGHMVPFYREAAYSTFLLAAQAPECLCCLPGGPATVVEVLAARPLPFRRGPLVLVGRLRLLERDECGYFYQLEEARPQDGTIWLQTTAADIERLWAASVHGAGGTAPASPLLGRRDLLRGAAAASTLLLIGARPVRAADPPDARGAAIIAGRTAADLHSHAGGRLGTAQSRNEYDVAARMVEGGFGLLTLAVVADSPVLRRMGNRVAAFRDPAEGECLTQVKNGFATMGRMVDEYHFRRVLEPEDIAKARQSGQAALLMATEGGDFIEGRLERVQWAFDQGLRHLQLMHYRVNDLGDIQTDEPRHNGLSDLGAAVVAECNRLGIIIDVAHASKAVVEAVCARTTAPVVLSHSSLIPAGSTRTRTRLISPEHARLVAATGGIIGVWPPGAVFADLDAYAGALADMAAAVGVDHVGIGSDMEGGIDEVFRSYADLPRLVDALLRKGFGSDDVIKITGANHTRLFSAVWSRRG